MTKIQQDATLDAELYLPVLDDNQSYPGEITPEEAELLSDSACFRTSSLPGWPEWKPLLMYCHELDHLVELSRTEWNTLDAHGLYPRAFSVSTNSDDVVYSTYEVEVWRSMLFTYLQRLCAIEHARCN